MVAIKQLRRILRRLVQYKEYFGDENAIYRIEHPTYTELSPELEEFYHLVYKLKIPDIAFNDSKKTFYGEVIDEAVEKYGVSSFDELCKQELNYIEIFSILTSVVRSCRMDDGFLAAFVESRKGYNILVRCEEILNDLY